MVPEARLELAQAQGPGDFESPASTRSTTPATAFIVSWEFFSWQAFYGRTVIQKLQELFLKQKAGRGARRPFFRPGNG